MPIEENKIYIIITTGKIGKIAPVAGKIGRHTRSMFGESKKKRLREGEIEIREKRDKQGEEETRDSPGAAPALGISRSPN